MDARRGLQEAAPTPTILTQAEVDQEQPLLVGAGGLPQQKVLGLHIAVHVAERVGARS